MKPASNGEETAYFHLALKNLGVFLALGSRLKPLPGKLASQKVHQHISQRLQIISATLLDPQVIGY